MYEQFFGLDEEPFRLTPDPGYLFLSPKHAEALAHLKLCLNESSGFVCITGDVGTGKTTLLRVFLSQLGPNVASAYTFVPPLTALELLRRICREFKLRVTDGETQGELVDMLHAFLIAEHEAGRLCVLILDEAQALSIELLEQIRLLLNLETDRQKLLRIVLVGQPQLRKLLLDPDLAQLNQRITLRWHLGPLSYRQTVDYVNHRLAIASRGRATDLFTRPALRLLHGISGGVPRLINMVAHRAMLAAFVIRQPTIDRRVVNQAYHEIQAVPLPGSLTLARKAAIAAAGLAVGVVMVAVGAPRVDSWAWNLSTGVRAAVGARAVDHDPTAGSATADVPVVAIDTVRPGDDKPTLIDATAVHAALAPEPHESVVDDRNDAAPLLSAAELLRRLSAVPADVTARASANAVLGLWGEPPIAEGEARLPDELEGVAWRHGLQQVTFAGNLSMLRLLDLPALVALRIPGWTTPRLVALRGLDAERALVAIDGATVAIVSSALEELWSGQAYVLWRDFDGLGPTLARGARGVAVARLQQLLRRSGTFRGTDTGVFDPATEAAVREFQRTHQLTADGLVGPLTRIVLYGVAGEARPPTLARGGRDTT